VAFDSVPVDPAYLETVIFKSAAPKYERQSDEEYRRRDQKVQKHTRDGVPVWSVQVMAAARPEGDRPARTGDFKVSVPMADDPAELFHMGEAVSFAGLKFGVSPLTKGQHRDYAVWWTAEQITEAGATSSLRAAS